MDPQSNAVFVLFPIITGAFFALAGAIMWTVWREVEKVRKRQHDQGTDITVQGAQIRELAKNVETILERIDRRGYAQ